MSKYASLLSLSEYALVILLKKTGKCSGQIIEKAINFKKKLEKEGKVKGLDKILLQIKAITPSIIGELLPEIKKMNASIKPCIHCKKKTFHRFKACIHCNKEIKKKQIFAEKRVANLSVVSDAPSCPNCKTQAWAPVGHCTACGASLATGNPGPESYSCKKCTKILKFDEAICSECGSWAPPRKKRKTPGEDSFVQLYGGKLLFLLTVGICLFLWRDPLATLILGKEEESGSKKVELSAKASQLKGLQNDTFLWSKAKNHLDKMEYDLALTYLRKMNQTEEVKMAASQCHFFLGIRRQMDENNNDALEHFQESKKLSEKAFLNFQKILK